LVYAYDDKNNDERTESDATPWFDRSSNRLYELSYR
jgi:hypothetical protein